MNLVFSNKRVVMAFSTQSARALVEILLPRYMDANLVLVAPKECLDDAWVKQVARYGRSRECIYLQQGQVWDIPVTLACAEVLCAVAEAPWEKFGGSLKFAEGIEYLLVWAERYGIACHAFNTDGRDHSTASAALGDKNQAFQRALQLEKERAALTRTLQEIRIEAEVCSSGLWANGGMLSYRDLDVPFGLICRLFAWQRKFDEQKFAPDDDDADWEQWWDAHVKEEVALAKALQQALGDATKITLYRNQQWLPVSEWIQD